MFSLLIGPVVGPVAALLNMKTNVLNIEGGDENLRQILC